MVAPANNNEKDKKSLPAKGAAPKVSSTPQAKTKRRGISLGAFCIGMVAVFVGGVLIWAFILKGDGKTRLQREQEALALQKGRAEIEKVKAVDQGIIAMARTRQNEALSLARSATNYIGQLSTELTKLSSEALALKSSDAGRAIAVQPDLVPQAKRLYENDLASLPTAGEITSRLEGVRRIEQQLVDSLGTGYEPDSQLVSTAQSTGRWAEDSLSKVRRTQALVASLTSEGAVKSGGAALPSSAPTLAVAISQLAQGETATRTRAIVEKTAVAVTEATVTLAEAEAKKIRDKAKAEADEILRAAREEAAATKRATAIEEAKSKIEDSKAEVKVKRAENEAERVLLRERATDPSLRAKLAPFITPGYQILPKGMSVEKVPHSYTQLTASGALDQTMDGLQKLVNIAHTRTDIVRPRWKFKFNSPAGWKKTPDDIEQVKEAQQLLIELGPVLVEMGMLAP